MRDRSQRISSPHPARRAFLAGIGAAALGGGAASVVLDPSPDSASASPQRIHVVDTVRDLAGLRAAEGDVAFAHGYADPGDIAPLSYRCVTRRAPEVNGGTVVAGRGGVWALMHDGVVEFRHFGIFDASDPADDALDAMLADEAIHRIEAHTPLNFVRRHAISRSVVHLDFGGQLMTTEGIEDAGEDDPFSAVMSFRGTATDETRTVRLGEDVPDLADVFPVGDASFFEVGSWYAAEVNPLSGRWERELQRLVQVTEIVDGAHIRVNCKNGWPLGADREITWTRIEPVHDVRVTDLVFRGGGADQFTGSHPLAFEYAVRCDAERIVGSETFWPLIMRRWNTFFRTTECSLANPTSVTWGGAGYLTQQISCLYGYIANCHTSNARHLNDFTGSAYCLVENCHGDGDDEGPFVTHGQYEHDLTYTGNSGLMTFANSGAAWGSSAKRITVRKHVCSWFVARVKVTDLTLEDVRVIGTPSLEGSGMMWINADGAQLRGCTASDTLVITQQSTASERPTVIRDSAFRFVAKGAIADATVTAPVTFVDTTFDDVDGMTLGAAGGATLRGCVLRGAGGALTLTSPRVHLEQSDIEGVSIVLAGEEAQELRIAGGSRLSGEGTGVAREGSADLRIALDGSSFSRSADAVHFALGEGVTRFRATGCRFAGGSLGLDASAFPEGSTLVEVGCVEEDVDRDGFPDDGPTVSTVGTIAV